MIAKPDASKVVRLFRPNKGEPMAIGCQGCPDMTECGGIRVAAGIFNCLSHCTCSDRNQCPHVCPNNPNYVARVHEVRGFGFDDIERDRPLPPKELPSYAHLLYPHPGVREPIELPVAAIPFSTVFDKAGYGATALTRAQIEEKFRLAAGTQLILSGVEQDHKVEKFWGVQRGREALLAGIKALDPLIVTVPNFSAFIDTPRHDVMHSLKRIALSWQELHDAGIRTAFHLNAITDRDYERIGEFLSYHTEIRAVSVEFETGAAAHDQGDHHTEQLARLVQRVGRKLHLVFRGDTRWLPGLHKSFPHLTLINGSATVRTRKRRHARIEEGDLYWTKVTTAQDEPLDDLLRHNLAVVGGWLLRRTEAFVPSSRRTREANPVARSEVSPEANDKARQRVLL